MRRSALLAVALAVMLALAGCGGTGETTTQTQTQNQTTTQATTQAAANFPPGIGENGVQSGFDLTNAHAEALQSANYTVSYSRTANYENGTSYESVAWTTQWSSETVYGSLSYNNAPPTADYSSITAWTNGSSVAFQRSPVENSSTMTSHVSGGVGEISFVKTPDQWNEYLYTLVASGQMEVEQTTSNEFTLTYTGDSTVTVNYAGETREVTPISLEITVNSEGFIQKANFEYETTVNDETVTVSELVIFQQGDVTVEHPAWA